MKTITALSTAPVEDTMTKLLTVVANVGLLPVYYIRVKTKEIIIFTNLSRIKQLIKLSLLKSIHTEYIRLVLAILIMS